MHHSTSKIWRYKQNLKDVSGKSIEKVKDVKVGSMYMYKAMGLERLYVWDRIIASR